MSISNFWVVLLLLVFSSPLMAQEEQETLLNNEYFEELDEVVVYAARTQRQLSSQPLFAEIIGEKELSNMNAVRLTDVLNEQTGLISVPDFGGGEGIQLEGFDSEHILVLIDGVPLIGRTAGTLDLSRISIGNIKQIEVIKGASSSLYGSEALGGVINIVTKCPNEGFEAKFNYRLASFDTHDINAHINFKKSKLGISSFFNRYSSNGYDLIKNDTLNTVEPFHNYTFNTQLSYDLNKKTSLALSGRYFHQKQNSAYESLSGESKIDEWNAHFRLKHQFNGLWESTLELYATQYQTKENFTNSENNPDQNDFDQLLVRPELKVRFNPNIDHSLIAGIGFTGESLYRSDFLGRPEFLSPYLYFQYDGTPLEKVNLILGGRWDHHNVYPSQFSPKAAILYEINNRLSLKASVGYGFKAPDFRQLYFDFTNSTVGYTVLGTLAANIRVQQLDADGQLISIMAVNYDMTLKPESSINKKIGLDYSPIKNLKMNISFFRNDIRDLIDTRVIARKTNGQNVFSYYNVNQVYTQGASFNSTWKVNQNLTVSGGYQLLFAKDKSVESSFERGEVFARVHANSPAFQLEKKDYFGLFNRSRHMANLKIFYAIPKWSLNMNLRGTFRSKYGLFDTNGNTFLDQYDDFVDAYTTWDFAINKTFYKNVELGLGADNIFNFKNPQYISNIAGRIFYGKLNFKF